MLPTGPKWPPDVLYIETYWSGPTSPMQSGGLNGLVELLKFRIGVPNDGTRRSSSARKASGAALRVVRAGTGLRAKRRRIQSVDMSDPGVSLSGLAAGVLGERREFVRSRLTGGG